MTRLKAKVLGAEPPADATGLAAPPEEGELEDGEIEDGEVAETSGAQSANEGAVGAPFVAQEQNDQSRNGKRKRSEDGEIEDGQVAETSAAPSVNNEAAERPPDEDA
ncbi:MAG: hypothetical protein AAF368_20310, partial [Planctomycetota bacterium]